MLAGKLSYTFMSRILLRASIALLLVLLGLSSLAAQAKKERSSVEPERPREIAALLNDARIAAPELGADTFLKVVEAGKVTDTKWKKEILDEVMRMADDVKRPYGLTISPTKGVIANNTEAGFIATAHSQRLNGLALKARAINQISLFDPEKAKTLLIQINGHLKLKTKTCEGILVDDVRDIYDTVIKVAKSAFDEKQISEGHRALFVSPWIENIESPVQVSPALKLALEMRSSPSEKQIVDAAFSRSIGRKFGDDRSFVAAMYALSSQLRTFTPETDSTTSEIRDALRQFIIRNLSDTRCAESDIGDQGELPSYIALVNKLFSDNPLKREDLGKADFKGKAVAKDLLVKSPEINRLRQELLSLTSRGTKERPLEFDKSDVEWQAMFTTFVDKLADWKSQEELSNIELFTVRSSMYGAAFQAAPEGSMRDMIATKWLRFLASAPMQKEDYQQWSKELNSLQTLVKGGKDYIADLAPELSNSNLRVITTRKRIGI